MPSIIIQDPNGDSRVLDSKQFAYEEVLQRNIADLPALLPLGTVSDELVSHLAIGAEWPAGGGRADIVLIGSDGILTVVETKLSRNPEARREVIAQLLEYAAYLSEWTIYEIQQRAEQFFKSDRCVSTYRDEPFDKVLTNFLEDSDESVEAFKGKVEQNLRQGRIRLIVAVDEVGEQAQKIVTFVNAYSTFDIYLLQIAEYEDTDGRRTFVPSLHGYARKAPSTFKGPREDWTWERYQTDLGWSDDQVTRIKSMLDRMVHVSGDWEPETRFNAGWINVFCFGRSSYGVQVSKKGGVEFWFPIVDGYGDLLPSAITRLTAQFLYVRDDPRVTDDALKELCRKSLTMSGLLPTADD